MTNENQNQNQDNSYQSKSPTTPKNAMEAQTTRKKRGTIRGGRGRDRPTNPTNPSTKTKKTHELSSKEALLESKTIFPSTGRGCKTSPLNQVRESSGALFFRFRNLVLGVNEKDFNRYKSLYLEALKQFNLSSDPVDCDSLQECVGAKSHTVDGQTSRYETSPVKDGSNGQKGVKHKQ